MEKIVSLTSYDLDLKNKTLTAIVNDEKREIVARLNKDGKFEPTIFLPDIDAKGVRDEFLKMFTKAGNEIKKAEEKLNEGLKKGINGYLNIQKQADLYRKSFKEKVEETLNKPFLRLQNSLHELKENIGKVIKESKTYPIYFESYQNLKETTQKVDYVASALTNPLTEDIAESIVNGESVGKALYARLDEIKRLNDLTKPIAEYDNTVRRILHGEIDHYDTARAIDECMKAIQEGLKLEKMVELTEEVYAYAGKNRDSALKGYNYDIHALCTKMSEYMGGMPTPFVNVQNLNNTDKSNIDFVKENYPKEFGLIMEGLLNKETEFGNVETMDLRAVKTTYYEEPCFELTIYNKSGTAFNLMFNPDAEVCQICKKEIDKEEGICIFNNTNNHQWIDLSATRNGESKKMIDDMPFVRKSLDKFVKDRGMGRNHEQVIGKENVSK